MDINLLLAIIIGVVTLWSLIVHVRLKGLPKRLLKKQKDTYKHYLENEDEELIEVAKNLTKFKFMDDLQMKEDETDNLIEALQKDNKNE